MAEIFISYRRADASAYAGRICDRLRQRFGAGAVFMDVERIEPGEQFRQVIETSLRSCQVFIALIGPGWASARAESGGRRLDVPDDLVRQEVALALSLNGIRVIPVLVGGARLPAAGDLPGPLAPLSDRQSMEIRDERFDADIKDLLEAIERAIGRKGWRRRPLAVAVSTLLLVAGIGLGAYLWLAPPQSEAPTTQPFFPVPAPVAPSPREPPTADATGETEAPAAWFGPIPPRVTGIASGGFNQFSQEVRKGGKTYGMFSYYLTEALAKGNGDRDDDGAVSWREAVDAAAATVVAESSQSQSPVYEGPPSAFALFAAAPLGTAERPHGKLFAVLVGINQYRVKVGTLQGPTNDVDRFAELLADRQRLLVREAEVVTLKDEGATQAAIWDAVEWLVTTPGPNDVSLLYYSGHQTTEREGEGTQRRQYKVIYPYDMHALGKIRLAIPELVAALGRSHAKHIVIIVDA